MIRSALGLGFAACLVVLAADAAWAQAPRSRGFSSSHDFSSDADLTRGAVVTEPGSDAVRTPFRRLSNEDSSVRLPRQSEERALPNLVRPNVTMDSSDPNYTSAPITDGKLIGANGEPGYVWISAETGEQHWVDLEFADGERSVSSVSVEWGPWRSKRFKVQVADERGWLVDVSAWLDGSASSSSFVLFPTVSTRRVRVVQDAGGGAGSLADGGTPRTNRMSVDELGVLAGPLPVARPVVVDSSYFDYAPSLITDGDTREGKTADFWTETWASAESAAQHWVEVRFFALTTVAQAEIHWGHWSSARFKVQYWDGASFVDTSSSAAGWLGADPWPAVSRVSFAPVETTRLRVLQDANGGRPPGDGRVGLMSVAELIVRPAQSFNRAAANPLADSSYGGYTPGAAFDGVRTNGCAPSDCDGPGGSWVSAETPFDHWLELDLGHLIEVGAVTLDWGAWGSMSFQLQYWDGASWVVAASGSMSSNQSASFAVNAATERLRVFQPAGAGAGRPGDGYVRSDLMSIGEILLGYPALGTYVSAPTRLSEPLAQVTLSSVQSNASPPQGVAYSVSADDGASWTPVSVGVPTPMPPGTLVRWRADLSSGGAESPEIEQVTLEMVGQPHDIGPALWRGGRAGAVSFGVDDSFTTFAEPNPALNEPNQPVLGAGVFGTYFQQNAAPYDAMRFDLFTTSSYVYSTFAGLGHEMGNHSESHACRNSPPDGSATNALDLEFTRKQDQLDALFPTRGRVQSLAWPCGNYDLAKGSVSRRFFVSSRGFRDGDPNGEFSCTGPGSYHCALAGGEPQDLLEEPTPRNFQNLRAIAADNWRSPSLADVKNVVHWAEAEGNWAVLAYHYFTELPYQHEVREAALLDLWRAPQGEVARYVKLRDSFASGFAIATPTTRDFTIYSTLGDADVPAESHARPAYPASELVERVFDGGVTARVWSPSSRGSPLRVRIWNNGVAYTQRAIEGNDYLLFEAPLTRAPAPIRVEWVDTPAGDDDVDGAPNLSDNCRYEWNPSQSDSGGVGAALPNLVGNACECGDLSDDGTVDGGDTALLRARLSNPSGTPIGAAGLAKCATYDGGPASCDIADLAVLRRRLATPPSLPGIRDACVAARPH